jgi:deoxyhypusine synthase
MESIQHVKISPGMTVGQLVNEMANCGVLGAGKIAKATDVLTDMFGDPDYKVFLALAGPMIIGGLRNVIGSLIDLNYVDVIITSGSNIVHDVIEALSFKHYKGTFQCDDFDLRLKGIGRVGDIFIKQKAFIELEKRMYEIFNEISNKDKRYPIYELLYEIGKRLKDKNSVLRKAAAKNKSIFSPGLFDSMIGMHIWTYNQIKCLHIDPVQDLQRLSSIVNESEKIGAIILGGGVPKHHLLASSILKDGVDAAIQITLDRPEGGSLSGAPLEEAISWKKAKTNESLASVIGDATILFPIIVAASLERLDKTH